MFLPGVNMIGGAVGPLLGSFLVTEHSARGAIEGAGVPLAIGIVLVFILAFRHAKVTATDSFSNRDQASDIG